MGKKLTIVSALAGLLLTSLSQASIIVTVENPGVVSSQVSGVSTVTFDSTSTGAVSNLSFSGFGTYTGNLNINSSDAFGGAGSTNYASVNATNQVTLTFLNPVAYFGLWWSAGDQNNVLDFYLGNTLLGTFSTSTLFPFLAPGHNGKPGTGQNASEPYAYVNFFGANGTVFDRIVFRNNLGSNFESDNHSIRQAEVLPPYSGTQAAEIATVPEPATLAITGVTLIFAGLLRRRR